VQNRELSGHLHTGLVENLAEKREISVRRSFECDKKDR
jgi:hypothetical protein